MKSKKQDTPVKNRRLDGYGLTRHCQQTEVTSVMLTVSLFTVACHRQFLYKPLAVCHGHQFGITSKALHISHLNMKFATKFLSRQGRRVHPEHVTSLSENNAKLRDARHHLQVRYSASLE